MERLIFDSEVVSGALAVPVFRDSAKLVAAVLSSPPKVGQGFKPQTRPEA